MDKSTDSCMTEKQWNKKGYVLKENAEGILGWQSCYYNYKVLRYTENEVEYKPECNRRSPTATGAVVNGHSAVRQRPA